MNGQQLKFPMTRPPGFLFYLGGLDSTSNELMYCGGSKKQNRKGVSGFIDVYCVLPCVYWVLHTPYCILLT